MAEAAKVPDKSTHTDSQPSASTTGSLRSARWLRGCMVVFIIYTILYVGLWKPMTMFGVDYDKHWQAARAILTGENNFIGGNLWIGFNYPQASAFSFAWLGLMSVETGEKVWKLTLLGLLVGCWLMAWRDFRPGRMVSGALDGLQSGNPAAQARQAFRDHWGLITAFALCAFEPATSCLYLGNIDPVSAFYAVAMVAFLLIGRPRWAGVVWALLTLVKMLPLALLVPVVFWRRWRVLQGFLIAMGAYFILLVVTGRLHYEWFFVTEIIPTIPPWWRYISITPVRFALHLFGQDRLYDDPHTFLIISRLNVLVMAVLYTGLLAWLRRRGVSWMRSLEIAILLYPLMTPLLEYHHFVWIMPAMLLQMRRWAEGRMTFGVGLTLLAGFALLFGTYHFYMIYARMGLWVHFTPLIGYAIILAAALYEVLRVAPRPAISSVTAKAAQEAHA